MPQTETPSPTAPLARMTPQPGTALPMPCPPGHCDLVLAPQSIMWYGADGPGTLTVDGLPIPPSGPMRVRLARVIW